MITRHRQPAPPCESHGGQVGIGAVALGDTIAFVVAALFLVLIAADRTGRLDAPSGGRRGVSADRQTATEHESAALTTSNYHDKHTARREQR